MKNYSNITTTVFLALLISYFSFQVISGERGLLAMAQLSNKVKEAKSELDVVRAERLKLEHKVKLLSPNSLDLDMLDEQSRRILGYAKPQEKIYSTSYGETSQQ
jgi:cell division protein FtsB